MCRLRCPRAWAFVSTRLIDLTLLGTQEDPELANLLMAWYYSGYYTGRYQTLADLQRQGKTPAPESGEGARGAAGGGG